MGDPMEPQVDARPMTPTWHALSSPDLPAIIMGASGETTTFQELEDRSSRFARALRARGVAAGAHIAVLMENNRAFLEVTWAAQRAGLYYTAINSHLRSSEVQYVLDDCGAVALVASEAMAEVVAGLDLSRVPIRISGAGELPDFERSDDVLSSVDRGFRARRVRGPGDVVLVGHDGTAQGGAQAAPGDTIR